MISYIHIGEEKSEPLDDNHMRGTMATCSIISWEQISSKLSITSRIRIYKMHTSMHTSMETSNYPLKQTNM